MCNIFRIGRVGNVHDIYLVVGSHTFWAEYRNIAGYFDQISRCLMIAHLNRMIFIADIIHPESIAAGIGVVTRNSNIPGRRGQGICACNNGRRRFCDIQKETTLRATGSINCIIFSGNISLVTCIINNMLWRTGIAYINNIDSSTRIGC